MTNLFVEQVNRWTRKKGDKEVERESREIKNGDSGKTQC